MRYAPLLMAILVSVSCDARQDSMGAGAPPPPAEPEPSEERAGLDEESRSAQPKRDERPMSAPATVAAPSAADSPEPVADFEGVPRPLGGMADQGISKGKKNGPNSGLMAGEDLPLGNARWTNDNRAINGKDTGADDDVESDGKPIDPAKPRVDLGANVEELLAKEVVGKLAGAPAADELTLSAFGATTTPPEVAERSKEETQDREADKNGYFDDGNTKGLADGDTSMRRGAPTVVFAENSDTFRAPAKTLPRMFYFENTYLGGSAAYAERLRRLERALQDETRPYEIVQAEVQPFDPPRTDGLGLTASVDTPYFAQARRVFLQVGLRGSARYGWRRPPLDIVLVVDRPAFQRGTAFVTSFVVEVLRQLGTTDRLGIVLAGQGAPVFLELTRLDSAQQHLANRIDRLMAPTTSGVGELGDAMRKAGVLLAAASEDEATVPGTKTILLLSGEQDPSRIASATEAAHGLTVEGCVTSVFALNAEQSDWWQVANAGYGNLHRISDTMFAPALDEEMKSIARVVARLVRVNVRLGKDVKAIRVLGTRMLEEREVEAVKARELATDLSLSKSLGITSDRGEDDDGIQTVIPYFYGDDSHVILIELWVEGPGMIADVTLRYKDMVNLDNAESRVSVRLGQRPQPATPEQVLISRNVRGFQLAETLQLASDAVYRNDLSEAVRNIGAAKAMANETNRLDVQALEDLETMVERNDWQVNPARRATVQETLLISGQRRVGDTNASKK